jgi:hypothetical protein
VEGPCEYGIEPSGSIKCWGLLEGLHNWRLLKKGSALCYVSSLRGAQLRTRSTVSGYLGELVGEGDPSARMAD